MYVYSLSATFVIATVGCVRASHGTVHVQSSLFLSHDFIMRLNFFSRSIPDSASIESRSETYIQLEADTNVVPLGSGLPYGFLIPES